MAGSRLDFDASWAIPCIGFEDLTDGDRFEVGDSFTRAGVRYLVANDGRGGERASTEGPGVVVETTEETGRRLRLRHATISPEFGARYDAWLLEFWQPRPDVVIGAGGRLQEAETLVALAKAGALHPGVNVVVDGGSSGRIRLRGDGDPLMSLAIGGTELVLDCPSPPERPAAISRCGRP